MTSIADPFTTPAQLADQPYLDERGIMRDPDGSPLIVPPGEDQPVPYRRISYLPSVVDNLGGIMRWKLQLLALQVAKDSGLAARIALCEYGTPELRELLDEAHDAAGGNIKADWGTQTHVYIEHEADHGDMPDEMSYDVAAYHCALERRGVTVLATELFVVDDERRLAGTLDAIYHVPSLGIVIGDAKTGTFHPMSCAIQLAGYAGARRFEPDPSDPTRGERFDLPASLNRSRGVVARIPRLGGSCTLTPVDLDRGRELLDLAMKLLPHQDRTIGAWCPDGDLVKVTRRECLLELISRATSREELLRIRDQNLRYWKGRALPDAANARWKELG